ncbi:MAG: FtsX-like permease family protein [Alphaproteobacteria bacterium]|uniref:FtsX-like permease family protein n=1 Tax=Candidatus Nitrobium versatile TaxID=2884831 RepID=A0A953LX91_9BACT|nr:FtsX-like permease family protein [Candidatus Nitrobium versatile]
MSPWIEKQRNIVDFTLSSLLRRKGKNTALALVYTFIIFILASVMFFTHALRKEASLVLKNAPDVVVQRMVAGRHDLIPADYADRLRKIRGVSGARVRLWGYYFDPVTGANYTLMVPEKFAGERGVIHIGAGIAKSRLASTGDMLVLRAYNGEPFMLKVTEVLSAESELVSFDLILMTEGDFRELFGIPKQYGTDVVLTVRNKKELTTVARKVTELLPDTRPLLRDEILRTYDSVFNWRGGVITVLLSGALFAFIIFAWDKASGLSAEEKKEIGILKAVGWETSDVLLMKFWEGAALSLSSFLAGTVLAYVHVFFASSPLFETALKGWSVLYPEFRLTPFIDGSQIATLFFLAVVPYTVATIVPSWRAATVDPDAVMR